MSIDTSVETVVLRQLDIFTWCASAMGAALTSRTNLADLVDGLYPGDSARVAREYEAIVSSSALSEIDGKLSAPELLLSQDIGKWVILHDAYAARGNLSPAVDFFTSLTDVYHWRVPAAVSRAAMFSGSVVFRPEWGFMPGNPVTATFSYGTTATYTPVICTGYCGPSRLQYNNFSSGVNTWTISGCFRNLDGSYQTLTMVLPQNGSYGGPCFKTEVTSVCSIYNLQMSASGTAYFSVGQKLVWLESAAGSEVLELTAVTSLGTTTDGLWIRSCPRYAHTSSIWATPMFTEVSSLYTVSGGSSGQYVFFSLKSDRAIAL